MCCFSLCGQIVYGLLMLACLAMTATSLFTSSWSQTKGAIKFPNADTIDTGLMPWNCVRNSQGDKCKDWWANTPGWQRAVVILMCISLILELVALAWNIVTFFACCCKKYIIHPLTLFAILITLCMAVALIIYGVNNKDLFKGNVSVSGAIDGSSALGWSFWVGVGAAVIAFADVIVGAMTVCLGESGL